MSAIKKFIDNEWRIFSATDAVNISTVFPGYRTTTDATYQPSTIYYWCYRSDKKLTTDVSKMTAGIDYKVGEAVGRVYFKNDVSGEYEPFDIAPQCVLCNSHYSVHDVLAKHDDEIALLKRNVSWLALHGGGGGGGGGGGTTGSKAKCDIFVCDKASVGTEGYVINKSGKPIKIDLRNFNIETSKKWTVTILCDSTLITTQYISYTNPTYNLPYSYISPYVVNHKLPNFIVQASYEDDAASVYGYSSWNGNLVDATVTLTTDDNTEINFDYRDQKTLSFNYSTGITHKEVDGEQVPIPYTLTVKVNSNSLEQPITYTKTFTIELGSGSFTPHFSEILEEGTNGVPFEQQRPGSYTLTSTLSAEFEGELITSEEVQSTVALKSNNAIYVSKYLSTIRDYPTTFSSDSKLNIKYIVYKNNETTFNVSYYVVTLDDAGHEKNLVATLAENVTERLSELIAYSFPTTDWKSAYVGTGEVLAVKTVIVTSNETLNEFTYFRITEGADNYITLSEDGEKRLFANFRVDEYSTLQTDNDYIELKPVKNWLQANNPVKANLYIPNKNNKTWIVEDSTTKQPSLRISNGVYAYLEDFFVGTKTIGQTFASTVSNQNPQNWTVSICYKSDYHPDDNRTILSCGTYKQENNELLTGFSINAHEIYIGKTLVARLTDSTVNTVDITCMQTTTKQESPDDPPQDIYAIKIFVNGVLTAITTDTLAMEKIKLGDRIYVGGRPETLYSKDKYLCDCNIYSIRLFTSALSDLDILSNYINNKIITSYYCPAGSESGVIDSKVREQEENKNLCKTVTETNRLSCDIYSQAGGYSITSFLDTDGLLSANKLDASQAKALGVPIVLVDVSDSTTGWTFESYHTVNKSLEPTMGKCQYWAPVAGSTLINFPVKVAIQGTSSLEQPTKNIDITLNNGDFFIPKAEWLPEQTYTIKVDMMDSAHSNNASIGKMINEVLGYDKDGNFKFFPADDLAKKAVYDTGRTYEGTHYDYHHDQQPLATLKHTVEGFPIFLIMRFRTDEGGQTIPIGIGSFNLGRKAFRNLGFKSLTYIQDASGNLAPDARTSSVTYPFFVGGASFHEISNDCEWIETKTLHNNRGMNAIDIYSVAQENGYPATFTAVDPQTHATKTETCKYDADFWQNDPNIVKYYSFEVQYAWDSRTQKELTEVHDDFVEFNNTIAKLPIESLQFSQIKNTVKDNYIKGKYRRLKYDPESGAAIEDPDVQYVNVSINPNDYNVANFNFDYDKLYYYFVIGMLFGLVDNFGKNVSYRRWNKVNQTATDDKGKYYADFYDLDTSLGLSNSGKETVEPDVWLKYIDNTKEGDAIYGYAKEAFYEDNTINSKTDTCSNNVISSFDNKLWHAIDSQFFRTITDAANGSNYSYRWWQLRHYLDDYVTKYNVANGTSYVNFVDFFTEEFFAKQTGSCGSLIFNYDYRLKYLMQFTPTDQTISETYCVYIHGRRIDYVRQWLKNHVLFLDTVMNWRDSTKFGNENLTFKNNIDSHVKFVVDGAQQEPYPIKTNSPIIMRSQVANNIDTFYWMKKNTKTYTNTIFNTNSPISVLFYNSPVIIEIGDSSTPFSYLKVNEIIYNSSTYGLDAPGLPSLTDLNFSTAFSFTSPFSTRVFSTGTISELRNIDFSATKNSKLSFPLDFKTSGKFTKITDIDISSSCITNLQLPDTPLLSLKVENSPITEFTLANQRYLKDISFEGCTNLQSIDISNCYSYDKVILDKAKNLQKVVIAKCENIKTIELTSCPNLTTVSIEACPNLEVIKITDAPNLCNNVAGGSTGLTIGNVGSLVEINVNGCTQLTHINILSMTNGEKLRTLDIAKTSVGYISGRCNGIEFEISNGGENLLDLSHFPNLGYNPTPQRKNSAGNNVNEYFACYWNNSIQRIKFTNDVNRPIKITQPFRSCDNLTRIFGHIILSSNPSMSTRTGNGLTGLFHGCSKFSIHGIGTTQWRGEPIYNGSIVRTAWELVALKDSPGSDRETYFNTITRNQVFVDTDNSNSGYVTNIRFANCSNAYYQMFASTSCTQFDVYYTLMMIALSDNTTTAGSLYETFLSTGSKFNWSTNGTSTLGNQPDIYTFFRLNGKITGVTRLTNTTYTYYKSPDVGFHHDASYDSNTQYNRGDVVSNGSDQYQCLKNAKGIEVSNTEYWKKITTYSSSTTYKCADLVKYNSNIWICIDSSGTSGSWTESKWKKILTGTFFVSKDNGLFSPIPNTSIHEPFSGSAIHSKWLFRRVSGKYSMSSIYFSEKIIVDIDCGRIYTDDDKYAGYFNFMEVSNYRALGNWSGNSLPITKSIDVDGNLHYVVLNTGNFDGFFDDFSYLTDIYGLNSFTLNFDKIIFPKSVVYIGGSGYGSTLCPNIARGTIDFSKMFPTGNSLNRLLSAFVINYYNEAYAAKGTRGRAQMPITENLFTTMSALTHFGYTSDYVNYYNCFSGDGIYKYIPEGTTPADWDYVQEHIFDPIATRIQTLSNVFNGLRAVTGWGASLPFPGKLFLKCKNLTSVHNFMANCQQKYYLTSDGFINCSNLKSVRSMCYYNSDYGSAPTINSTLTGEIPYRFFYQGFIDNTTTTYGCSNGSELPPATVRLTDSMDDFCKYTLKYSNNTRAEGEHTVKFNKYGIFVDSTSYPAADTEAYSTTKSYVVGNIVIYNANYYVCIKDSPAGAWDSNKWEQMFESVISVINCCNMKVNNGDTYNGTAIIKVTKTDKTQPFYATATVTITTNKKQGDDVVVDTKVLNFDLDNTENTVEVENVCKKHTNNSIGVLRNIIDMNSCFHGCNNITPYNYETSVSTIVSKTKKDGGGAYIELDKPFVIKAKNAEGNLVDKEVGRLELNPDYNPYEWIYNTSTDVWEKNTDNMTNKEYCGYWSYNGNTDLLYIKRDGSSETVIADNRAAFNSAAFIEPFNVVSPKQSLLDKETNYLSYCCPPDLFRYTANAATISIGNIFANCGCYGATLARGMQGRICPYLLKPLSTVTNIDSLFRNCRRLSSYMYGSQNWVDTIDTKYNSSKTYYWYIEGLPTMMVEGVDYHNGDTIAASDEVKEYKIVYDSDYVYQIPDTFFDYTLKISSLVGTFSGLIFLYNTKLDIFDKLTASANNICGVYAACHYITYSSMDLWVISACFGTLQAKYASGCFSLAYLGYNSAAKYYCSEPTQGSTVTCYYGGYLDQSGMYKNFSTPGNKLSFLNNFNGTRMGDAVKTAMYNWWGFVDGSTGPTITERSGVSTSKTV